MTDSQGVTRRDILAGAAALAGAIVTRAQADPQSGVQAASTHRGGSDIKVIALDTFGTVVDWRSVIIAEGQQLSKTKGFTVDWPAFVDEWRAAYGPSMNRVRSGELPWTKLDVLHRMSLDALLERHGITWLTEAEKRAFNRAWHRGTPWPDSVPGLTRLKKRFTIAPLSNGNIGLLTDMAKNGGLPWDCILGAELVRHYKPDPEIYMSPVEFFDLTPPEVLFVAAHLGDLRGPKRLGLKTAYVHRPYEGGSADGPGQLPPPDGSFDFIVKDLNELATALGV